MLTVTGTTRPLCRETSVPWTDSIALVLEEIFGSWRPAAVLRFLNIPGTFRFRSRLSAALGNLAALESTCREDARSSFSQGDISGSLRNS